MGDSMESPEVLLMSAALEGEAEMHIQREVIGDVSDRNRVSRSCCSTLLSPHSPQVEPDGQHLPFDLEWLQGDRLSVWLDKLPKANYMMIKEFFDEDQVAQRNAHSDCTHRFMVGSCRWLPSLPL